MFAHTDFRLYWTARLGAATRFLKAHGHLVNVVEIAGKGSPYAFGTHRPSESGQAWQCLFPEIRMEDVPVRKAFGALWACLDKLNPDVVVAGAIAFPSGATAVRWAKVRRRRVVIMDDARISDVPRNTIVNWVKRRVYRSVDAVFIPAASHLLDYRSWGVPNQKMFFGVDAVDNALYCSRANSVRAEPTQWRAKLRLPAKFLLGVGRQVAKKNWSALLMAWRSFKDKEPGTGYRLVLVGNGPEHRSLRDLTEALHLDDVTFVDFVQPEDVIPFYALATALVLPSHGETWGLVVNEAMACGLPVLVSRQCGCAETLINPGQNGWIFDAEDTSELTNILVRLNGLSKSGLECMGKRSLEIIADWGLERFCTGVLSAARFAITQRTYRPSIVERLILLAWKGRYRPV